MTKFGALVSIGVVSILLQGCTEDESGKPDDEGTPADAYEGEPEGWADLILYDVEDADGVLPSIPTVRSAYWELWEQDAVDLWYLGTEGLEFGESVTKTTLQITEAPNGCTALGAHLAADRALIAAHEPGTPVEEMCESIGAWAAAVTAIPSVASQQPYLSIGATRDSAAIDHPEVGEFTWPEARGALTYGPKASAALRWNPRLCRFDPAPSDDGYYSVYEVTLTVDAIGPTVSGSVNGYFESEDSESFVAGWFDSEFQAMPCPVEPGPVLYVNVP